jgi:hypothetical protein
MVVLAGIPSTGNKFVPNRKLSQHPFPRERALGGKEWCSFVAMLSKLDRQPEDVQATLMTKGCHAPKLVAEHHLKVI